MPRNQELVAQVGVGLMADLVVVATTISMGEKSRSDPDSWLDPESAVRAQHQTTRLNTIAVAHTIGLRQPLLRPRSQVARLFLTTIVVFLLTVRPAKSMGLFSRRGGNL